MESRAMSKLSASPATRSYLPITEPSVAYQLPMSHIPTPYVRTEFHVPTPYVRTECYIPTRDHNLMVAWDLGQPLKELGRDISRWHRRWRSEEGRWYGTPMVGTGDREGSDLRGHREKSSQREDKRAKGGRKAREGGKK
eukprot:3850476-Rhodomonas_salina.1